MAEGTLTREHTLPLSRLGGAKVACQAIRLGPTFPHPSWSAIDVPLWTVRCICPKGAEGSHVEFFAVNQETGEHVQVVAGFDRPPGKGVVTRESEYANERSEAESLAALFERAAADIRRAAAIRTLVLCDGISTKEASV